MKKIALVAATLLIFAGCYNDKYDKLYPTPVTTTCDTNVTISYANDIRPIIVANCYNPAGACHSATGSSGYNYDIFSVIQGNAQNGDLMTDITGHPTARHNAMPLNSTPLPSCDINKIARWITEGAPNN